MKKTFISLSVFCLIAAGCTVQNQSNTTIKNQTPGCEQISLAQDTDYKNTYYQIGGEETNISGILKANPKQTQPNSLMRNLPYNVGGVNLYLLANLDTYIGKKVIIEGKLNKFELEGQNLTEIWPNTLCVQN